MHEGQLTMSAPTVRALIAEQFPHWAGFVITAVRSAATVNALFRIGDGLVARFPVQGADPAAITAHLAREWAAAEEIAGASPFPTPLPVALGRPGAGYPLPWAVQTWLPGAVATPTSHAGSLAFAEDLAHLIGRLRAAPTAGRRFAGDNRGGDLARHDRWVADCLDRSTGLLDVAAIAALWARMRRLPRAASDVMSHGDLTPFNLLTQGDRLTGVLDVGGFGPADPSLDLVCAWHLLDEGPRELLRARLGCDELEWQRGRAWALEQAIGLVWYYRDTNPAMSELGVTSLHRILAAGSGDVDDARPN